MGRRSRKRSTEPLVPPPPPATPAPPPAAPRTATYTSRREDAPKAAWDPFPLTELGIALALVLLVVGFVTGGTARPVLIGAGLVVLTLSAGELALREHLAGYRSHTTLLAGAITVFSAYLLRLLFVPPPAVPPLALLIFGGAFFGLRRAFSRRSGGVGFRT